MGPYDDDDDGAKTCKNSTSIQKQVPSRLMGLPEASLALTSTLSLNSKLLREGLGAELSFGVTFRPVVLFAFGCTWPGHLAWSNQGIKGEMKLCKYGKKQSLPCRKPLLHHKPSRNFYPWGMLLPSIF